MLQRGSPKYCMDSGIGLFGSPSSHMGGTLRPSPRVRASPRPLFLEDDPEPLMPPSRAVDLDSEDIVQLDAMSPGYVSRIARVANRLRMGEFPSIHLASDSLSSTCPTINPRALHVRRPVKVQIAPPAYGTTGLIEKSISNNEPSAIETLDKSTKCVIQVLKAISRKRVHIPLDSDINPVEKRLRLTEHNLSMSQLENSTQTYEQPETILKRGWEQCDEGEATNGNHCETKRNRTCNLSSPTGASPRPHGVLSPTRNNEILSSLSSSVGITPPHLLNNRHHPKVPGSTASTHSERPKRKKSSHRHSYVKKEEKSVERSESKETGKPQNTGGTTDAISPMQSADKTKAAQASPPKIFSPPPTLELIKKGTEEKEESEDEEPPPHKKTEILEKVVTRPMVNALLKSAITKFVSTGDASVIPIVKPMPLVAPSPPAVSLSSSTSSTAVKPAEPLGLSGGQVPLSPVVVSSPSVTPAPATQSPAQSKPEPVKPTFSFGSSPVVTTMPEKVAPAPQFQLPEQKPPENKEKPTSTATIPTFGVGSFEAPKSTEPKNPSNPIPPSGFKFGVTSQGNLNEPTSFAFVPGTNKQTKDEPQLSFGTTKPSESSTASPVPSSFSFQTTKPASFQFGATGSASTVSTTTMTGQTTASQTASKESGGSGFTFQPVVASAAVTTQPPSFGTAAGAFGAGSAAPKTTASTATTAPLSIFGTVPTTAGGKSADAPTVMSGLFGSAAPATAPSKPKELPAATSAGEGIFGSKLFNSTGPHPSSSQGTSASLTTVTATTSTIAAPGGIFSNSTFGAAATTAPIFGNAVGKPSEQAKPIFGGGGIFGAPTPDFGQNKPSAPVGQGPTSNAATTTASTAIFGAGIFGSPAVTTTASASAAKPSGGFSYNLTANNPPAGFGDAAKRTFSFQTPTTTVAAGTKPSEQKPAVFSFGGTQSGVPSFGGTTTASTGFASFGGAKAAPAPPAFGTATSATSFGASGFGASSSAPAGFGAAPGQQQAAPTFGSAGGQLSTFGSAGQQAAPAFGALPAPASNPAPAVFGSSGAAENKPMFSFSGGTTSAPATATGGFGNLNFGAAKPFNFGGATTPAQPVQAQPAPGVFTFGTSSSIGTTSAAQPVAGTFQFNAPPQTPQATGFNFNASTPTFQLGGGAPMFSIGSGSTAPRNRTMRTRRRI